MTALVDTSAWIEFFRPRGRNRVRHAVSTALAEGLVFTVAPVVAELLVGLDPRRSADARAIERLRALEIVALTWDVCGRAGNLGRTLARRGQRVPTVDLIIAAAASVAGHEVWHVGDRHFVLIEQVGGARQRDLTVPNPP